MAVRRAELRDVCVSKMTQARQASVWSGERLPVRLDVCVYSTYQNDAGKAGTCMVGRTYCRYGDRRGLGWAGLLAPALAAYRGTPFAGQAVDMVTISKR